jgi:hypothetical protein
MERVEKARVATIMTTLSRILESRLVNNFTRSDREGHEERLGQIIALGMMYHAALLELSKHGIDSEELGKQIKVMSEQALFSSGATQTPPLILQNKTLKSQN